VIDMATGLARKLWSIEEYERMIELGILNKNHHVELIRGEIVEMAPIGLRHVACVSRLQEIFYNLLGMSVTIFGQSPVRLPNDSEPEPDVSILRRREDHYEMLRPTPQDILLLIEVSDSTLMTDRRNKIPLYAEAGVSEVWLVNLDEGAIEVYSKPTRGVYSKTRRAMRGEELLLPDALQGSINVDKVLGKS
jgi:Uma2 family endonuclease